MSLPHFLVASKALLKHAVKKILKEILKLRKSYRKALLACAFGAAVLIRRLRTPAPKVKDSEIYALGHKFVTLPDGRKLEYSVKGDPDGEPIYYQHAYLCGCFLSPVWDSIAKRHGIKLIAASMPGFGYSDSYPLGSERSLLDWPADVLVVLKQEKIAKAHFFGISAGCVHVAAIVRDLPVEMIGNVCFITPTCPDDVPGATDQMSFSTMLLKRWMGKAYIGDLLAFVLARLMTRKALLTALPDCKAAFERAEREHVLEVSQVLIGALEHGLQFTYRGIVDNACTIEKPLPFELRELQRLTKAGRAVGITSADDDTTTPPIMQRWFHRDIPGSSILKFKDGWGHLHSTPRENFERILNFLRTGVDPEKPAHEEIAGFRLWEQSVPHEIRES